MPSPFVPFLKSQPRAASERVATDSAATSAAFTALAAGGAKEIAACAHAPSTAEKATVTLEKDGERVTRIRIACRCGEVIELDCEY